MKLFQVLCVFSMFLLSNGNSHQEKQPQQQQEHDLNKNDESQEQHHQPPSSSYHHFVQNAHQVSTKPSTSSNSYLPSHLQQTTSQVGNCGGISVDSLNKHSPHHPSVHLHNQQSSSYHPSRGVNQLNTQYSPPETSAIDNNYTPDEVNPPKTQYGPPETSSEHSNYAPPSELQLPPPTHQENNNYTEDSSYSPNYYQDYFPKSAPFTSKDAATASTPVVTKTIINEIIKHIPVIKTIHIPIPVPIYEPYPLVVPHPHPIYFNIPQHVDLPNLQAYHASKDEKPYSVELSSSDSVPEHIEHFEIGKHLPVEETTTFPETQDYFKHLFHSNNNIERKSK